MQPGTVRSRASHAGKILVQQATATLPNPRPAYLELLHESRQLLLAILLLLPLLPLLAVAATAAAAAQTRQAQPASAGPQLRGAPSGAAQTAAAAAARRLFCNP